jgi:hypothetical protein
MTILVQDTFNRANTSYSTTGLGTATTGQVWQTFSGYEPNGQARIQTNQAQVLGSDNGQVINTGVSDCSVSVKFVSLANNPQLIFRANPSDTSYKYIEYSGGTWHIFRYNGSASWEELASGGTGVNGDIIKVTLQGTSVTVFKNGIQIMTTTDTTNVTSTNFGLGCGSTVGALFDDFQVEDFTTGGTVQTGTSTILSSTSFNSSGIPIRRSNGTINGVSTFSPIAIPIRLSNSTILGYGTLTANSSVGSQILANAILNGSSLVSVTVGSQSLASAILQSTTHMSANGLKLITGNSQVNGISSTSFNGVRIILSDSGINVDSDLQTNASRLIIADSQLNGNSGLLSDSIRLINLASDINIHSTMTVFIGERYVQVIPIAVDIKRNELIVVNIHRGEVIQSTIKRKSAIQVNI